MGALETKEVKPSYESRFCRIISREMDMIRTRIGQCPRTSAAVSFADHTAIRLGVPRIDECTEWWSSWSIDAMRRFPYEHKDTKEITFSSSEAVLSQTGAFAAVMYSRCGDRKCATKTSYDPLGVHTSLTECELAETWVYATFRHPNMTACRAISFVPDTCRPAIVMDRYATSLRAYGEADRPDRIWIAWTLLWDMGHVLAYLHAHGVLHGDIKPANILLSNADDPLPTFHLSDFGLATVLSFARDQRTTAATTTYAMVGRGSRYFAAPEMGELKEPPAGAAAADVVSADPAAAGNTPFVPIADSRSRSRRKRRRVSPYSKPSRSQSTELATVYCNPAADIYSLGATVLYFLTGGRPDAEHSWADHYEAWLEESAQTGTSNIVMEVWLGQLFTAMMRPDPSLRPTAHEIIVSMQTIARDPVVCPERIAARMQTCPCRHPSRIKTRALFSAGVPLARVSCLFSEPTMDTRAEQREQNGAIQTSHAEDSPRSCETPLPMRWALLDTLTHTTISPAYEAIRTERIGHVVDKWRSFAHAGIVVSSVICMDQIADRFLPVWKDREVWIECLTIVYDLVSSLTETAPSAIPGSRSVRRTCDLRRSILMACGFAIYAMPVIPCSWDDVSFVLCRLANLGEPG